jgi:hypothetical protein
MRNKILIVSPWHEEKKELEQILAFIPQNGGEIFFTQSEESGLQLLKKEHPQIVFLDEIFASHIEKWF